MDTITLPADEYISLKNELNYLKEQELLAKINSLIDLLFESKYGIYLGDFTEDLTKASISSIKEWELSGEKWNEL